MVPGAIAIGIAIPLLLLIFRTTAAVALLVFILLHIFFPLHCSIRALNISLTLFFAAIVIPVDIYIKGFNGPLFGSQHSGLRFVQVVHGLPTIQENLDMYGEFIADGCLVGIHDTRWRLVWD